MTRYVKNAFDVYVLLCLGHTLDLDDRTTRKAACLDAGPGRRIGGQELKSA